MADRYQEALDNLYKLRGETYNVYQKHKEWSKEIEKYDAVGKNLRILQELVDKATPKKVIKFTSEITNSEEAYDFYTCIFYTCPKCKMPLSNDIYCPKCGQKLDWSDK